MVLFDEVVTIDAPNVPGYEISPGPIDVARNRYLVVAMGAPGRNYLIGGTLTIDGNDSQLIVAGPALVMNAGVPQLFDLFGITNNDGFHVVANGAAGQVAPYDTRLYVAAFTP